MAGAHQRSGASSHFCTTSCSGLPRRAPRTSPDAGVVVDAQSGRRVALRVEVQHEHLEAGSRQRRGQLTAVVVFPTPPFWLAIVMMRVSVGAGSAPEPAARRFTWNNGDGNSSSRHLVGKAGGCVWCRWGGGRRRRRAPSRRRRRRLAGCSATGLHDRQSFHVEPTRQRRSIPGRCPVSRGTGASPSRRPRLARFTWNIDGVSRGTSRNEQGPRTRRVPSPLRPNQPS